MSDKPTHNADGVPYSVLDDLRMLERAFVDDPSNDYPDRASWDEFRLHGLLQAMSQDPREPALGDFMDAMLMPPQEAAELLRPAFENLDPATRRRYRQFHQIMGMALEDPDE